MTRYFFDVSNGSGVSDDVGLDFDDAQTASQEALRSLPDMVKDQLLTKVGEKVSVTMRDDHGIPVYRANPHDRGRVADTAAVSLSSLA